MALQKQVVSVDLTGGLDKKTDANLVMPGKLLVLKNGFFDSGNTIKKRYGTTQTVLATPAGGHITTQVSKAIPFENQVLLDCDSNLYALKDLENSPPSVIQDRGARYVSMPAIQRVVQSAFSATNLHASGGTVVYNVGTAIKMTSIDTNSGVGIYNLTIIATGYFPKVIESSGSAMVYYADGSGNLKVITVTLSSSAISAATSLKTDCVASTTVDQFDMFYYGGTGTNAIAAIAYNTTGPALVAFKATPAGVSASHTIAAGSGGYTPAIIGAGGAGSTVGVLFDSATDVKFASVAANFGSDTTIMIEAGVVAAGMELYLAYGTSAGSYYCTHTIVTAACTRVRYSLVSSGIVLTTGPTTAANDVIPIGHGIELLNGSYTTQWVCRSLQKNFPAYFLCGFSFATGLPAVTIPYVYGRFLDDQCPGTNVGGRPRLTTGAAFPLATAGDLVSGPASTTNVRSGIAFLYTDVAGATTDASRVASSTYSLVPSSLDGGVFLPSGCPHFYDGAQYFEAGYHTLPEIVSVADGAAGAGTAGVHSFIAVYEWTDARGKLWRSAPSLPVSLTSAGTVKFDIVAKYLRLTNRTSPQEEVQIVFYATEAGGVIYHRISPATGGSTNSPKTNGQLSVTIDVSDANLVSGETLYTTGGVLENIPPPQCLVSEIWDNRLWCFDSNYPRRVRYSKEYGVTTPPEFTSELEFDIPFKESGRGTAISRLDDKLLFFGDTGEIFYLTGAGPNDAGSNNGYSPPRLLAEGFQVRADLAQSVKYTSIGVVFQCTKGLRLVNAGMQVDPAWGVEVDNIYLSVSSAAPTISSVVNNPSQNQIQFFTAETSLRGQCYVFDTLFGQWSQYNGILYGQRAACVFLAKGATVPTIAWFGPATVNNDSSNASIYTVDSNGYASTNGDNGTAIDFTVETSWLKFAGVQGFQRVWRTLLLGASGPNNGLLLANRTIQLSYAYDYLDTFSSPVSFTPGTNQIRQHMARQKCEALRVRIAESSLYSTIGVDNLSFEVGAKKGANKPYST